MNSRLFIGKVRHCRLEPSYHQFQYRLFMLYLDLAELDQLFEHYWFWSSRGFNIAAFKREKYLGDVRESLLDSVHTLLETHQQNLPQRVGLLTNLAYYGYCFNPVSFYFCLDQHELRHCLVEVTNTPWLEQHVYVLPAKRLRQDIYQMDFDKTMHVSPFLGMDYQYRLRCKYNLEQIIIQLENWQQQKRHFYATLTLKSKPINHRNLAKILLQFPFMTGKIISAIHWQALKLWLKKVPIFNHPDKKHETNH